MFKNYIKTAWRNFMKNKVFSFINIFGLSVGLTCCMLIALYLQHELSYDTGHKNRDRIYQLTTAFVREGKQDEVMANTPARMAQVMQNEFPEIAKTTRLMRLFADDKTLLQYRLPGNSSRSFYEKGGFIADSTFFQFFSYRFTEGNPATALIAPNSIVLSEEIARKLFGHEPALNKVIHASSNTNGDYDFKVTGVFAPSTIPTHIDARFFMSMNGGSIETYLKSRTDLATNNMFHTYLLLHPGSDAAKLEKKFPAFVDKHIGKELKALGYYKKQYLVRLADIHLRSNTTRNVTPGGSVTYLYILGCVALFTLLIACINFMNLSTARSSKRSAEVGVRKVLGAEKKALIKQFLGESLMMSLLAFIVALGFTGLLLPLFAQVSGKELVFTWQQQGILLAGFLALAIVTGLVAGSYPAFYLSSFKPVKVLKGKINASLAAVSIRKVLVVFQFAISAVLIIASLVIANQMTYIRSKDLGFIKDQQVVIPLRSGTAKRTYIPLRNSISQDTRVQSVGASLYYPGIFNPQDMPLYKEGRTMNDSRIIKMNRVDDRFLQTLGIELISGHYFTAGVDTTERVILNEQAIKEMGYANAQEATDKDALIDWQGQTYRLRIVGVMKDFHFQDLHVPIEPFGFRPSFDSSFNYLIAHINSHDLAGAIQSIQASWHKLNPNEPFEYSFLDQDFQKNYEADNRLTAIVGYFTIIAILVSCLGLFGLATFSAEQRNKEIGIRKVLGASVTNIVLLLSKDFLKLVIIAIVIATPLAWYVMNQWLQDFAYRTPIGWWIFVLAASLGVLIAFITISFQAIRAAIANPVRSLKTE